MDIYSALVGGAPTSADQQQALAQALRRQNILGTMMQISGDRGAAPAGERLSEEAQQGAQSIQQGREKAREANMAQQYHEDLVGARNYSADRRLEGVQDTVGGRLTAEQMREQSALAVAKIRALTGGTTDPKDEQTLARAVANKQIPETAIGQGRNSAVKNHILAMAIQQGGDTFMYGDAAIQKASDMAYAPNQYAGKSLDAIRTAVSHIQLYEQLVAAQKDPNADPVFVRGLMQKYQKEVDGAGFQPTADAASRLISKETNRVYNVSGGGVQERADFQADIAPALQAGQIDQALGLTKDMMMGKVDSLHQGYISAPARAAAISRGVQGTDQFGRYLSPEVLNEWNSRHPETPLQGLVSPGSGPAVPGAAAPAVPGAASKKPSIFDFAPKPTAMVQPPPPGAFPQSLGLGQPAVPGLNMMTGQYG